MESNHEFASFKAWRGEIQVTFSVGETDPAAVAAFIDRVLASGFSAQLKGVEAGETVEDIGYVSRKEKLNDDGTYTPVLVLYSSNDKATFNIGRAYLNTTEDVKAAESALGIKIDSIALYDGEGYLQRGKDPHKDAKYIVRLATSAKAIFKPNPNYVEGAMKPKQYFERWHSTAPAAPQVEQQPESVHVWTKQEAAAFTAKWTARGYGGDVLRVLGITRMGECKLTPADADYLMEQHAVKTILDVEPPPNF